MYEMMMGWFTEGKAAVMGGLSTIFPWMADDAMVLAAQSGQGIGPEAYNNIPMRIRAPPPSLLVAYEQAAYYIALALRRAIDNNNSFAQSYLSEQLAAVLADGEAQAEGSSAFCRTVGGGFPTCRMRGSYAVLGKANEAIRLSSLEIDDGDAIRFFIKRIRLIIVVRTTAPVVGLAAGTAFLVYWFREES